MKLFDKHKMELTGDETSQDIAHITGFNQGLTLAEALVIELRDQRDALLAACTGTLGAIHEEKLLQSHRGESVSVSLGIAQCKLAAAIALCGKDQL